MDIIWKYIVGFEGFYQISNTGLVKSCSRESVRKNGRILTLHERIVKPSQDSHGYPRVGLWINGRGTNHKIHRLVTLAFIPNPENKPFINHINGIKTDFSINNLEWCTHQENCRHAYDTGLNFSRQIGKTGSQSHHAKAIIQMSLDGSEIKQWDCAIDVERELGFHHNNISKVALGLRNSAHGFKWKFAS